MFFRLSYSLRLIYGRFPTKITLHVQRCKVILESPCIFFDSQIYSYASSRKFIETIFIVSFNQSRFVWITSFKQQSVDCCIDVFKIKFCFNTKKCNRYMWFNIVTQPSCRYLRKVKFVVKYYSV